MDRIFPKAREKESLKATLAPAGWPRLFAHELVWNENELIGSIDLLPGEVTSTYFPEGIQVSVTFCLIPSAVLRDTPPTKVVKTLAEFIHMLANATPSSPVANPICIHGIPCMALEENVMPGVGVLSLSYDSRARLSTWSALTDSPDSRMHGFAIPRLAVQKVSERFNKELLVTAFRQAAEAGWMKCPFESPYFCVVDSVWSWKQARCILALKWLGALRASKHLTPTMWELRASLYPLKILAELEKLPNLGKEKHAARKKHERDARPIYNKRSALLDAAKKAVEELCVVFPSLGDERPKTASLQAIRAADLTRSQR